MSLKSTHWSTKKERGSVFGMKILLALYQYGGKWLVKLALYPVIGYFIMSGKSARNASQEYFNKLYACGYLKRKPRFRDSFLHFMSMAESALDKVDVWLGNITIDDINFINIDAFQNCVDKKQGALLIGSHLGNLEICRALSQQHVDVVFNVLVFTQHAQKFNEFIAQINPDTHVNLIEVSTIGPDLAVTLREKIDNGEYVVIAGDRTSTSVQGRVIEVDFMGAKAPFSQGPFILASLMNCPILSIFCLKKHNKFDLSIELILENAKWSRGERAQVLTTLITTYAKRLENYCALYPYQWFNFFDFWQSDKASRS